MRDSSVHEMKEKLENPKPLTNLLYVCAHVSGRIMRVYARAGVSRPLKNPLISQVQTLSVSGKFPDFTWCRLMSKTILKRAEWMQCICVFKVLICMLQQRCCRMSVIAPSKLLFSLTLKNAPKNLVLETKYVWLVLDCKCGEAICSLLEKTFNLDTLWCPCHYQMPLQLGVLSLG